MIFSEWYCAKYELCASDAVSVLNGSDEIIYSAVSFRYIFLEFFAGIFLEHFEINYEYLRELM